MRPATDMAVRPCERCGHRYDPTLVAKCFPCGRDNSPASEADRVAELRIASLELELRDALLLKLDAPLRLRWRRHVEKERWDLQQQLKYLRGL